jgi:acetylornithine deacetylase/succinyl-diaminopimelate desuccinylase-like protein
VAQRGSCVVRLTARGVPGHSAEQLPPGERAGVILARAMTAIIEVRVIEGMTKDDVPNELRSALVNADLHDRVEIALADPPHDWIPPSSAVGATRLTEADYPTSINLTEALVRAYTIS